MTDLREIVARAIDPEGWAIDPQSHIRPHAMIARERRQSSVDKADAVLAAMRRSGLQMPKIAVSVVDAAAETAIAAMREADGDAPSFEAVRFVVEQAAPLIAAAAEAKAREECARIADEAKRMREELFEQNGASINAARAVQAEEIAAAIRTGAAP